MMLGELKETRTLIASLNVQLNLQFKQRLQRLDDVIAAVERDGEEVADGNTRCPSQKRGRRTSDSYAGDDDDDDVEAAVRRGVRKCDTILEMR